MKVFRLTAVVLRIVTISRQASACVKIVGHYSHVFAFTISLKFRILSIQVTLLGSIIGVPKPTIE